MIYPLSQPTGQWLLTRGPSSAPQNFNPIPAKSRKSNPSQCNPAQQLKSKRKTDFIAARILVFGAIFLLSKERKHNINIAKTNYLYIFLYIYTRIKEETTKYKVIINKTIQNKQKQKKEKRNGETMQFLFCITR